MLDHNIARQKKRHYLEKAKGLKGLFAPMTNLQAHNWIRREIEIRTNLYHHADNLISNQQLYNDLGYEPQKKA